MSEESFIREVDEAVRQDQLRKLWNKYGMVAVAGAVLIVAGVGGYKAWEYWTAQRAAEAGARFVGGLTQLEDGNTGEAVEVFRSLAGDGPGGYRNLARLQLAALYARDGKTAEAVEIYDGIASGTRAGAVNRDFARIQAAALRLDEAPFDEMRDRLEGLAGTGSHWRHSARELLGLSAYRNGDTAAAERYFSTMMSDRQTPANMRQRVEMMLALLVKAGGDTAPAGN